ncbi:MAG: hypothetical protein LBV17_02565 [Treponema sp.]|jgi:hypothetical protein|nr:hypothetical protein [Treponema sp.]
MLIISTGNQNGYTAYKGKRDASLIHGNYGRHLNNNGGKGGSGIPETIPLFWPGLCGGEAERNRRDTNERECTEAEPLVLCNR